MKLRALAPGKVNLCLFLGGPMPDGRHELVTLIESVSLADELALETRTGARARDQVVCEGVEGRNLVSDAIAALRRAGWDGPPVSVEINKRIPVAAGMGGGSADAAAALRIAEVLSPVGRARLHAIAAALGADVPSQLAPGLWLGTGAGDAIEPIDGLGEHAFVIVPQRFGLATADVYAEADRLGLGRNSLLGLRTRIRDVGAQLPAELVVNDLQPAALTLAPALGSVLDAVRDAGADHALVSGSGPTVAGLFWGQDAERRAGQAASELERSHPGAAAATPVDRRFGLPRPL